MMWLQSTRNTKRLLLRGAPCGKTLIKVSKGRNKKKDEPNIKNETSDCQKNGRRKIDYMMTNYKRMMILVLLIPS